MNQILFSVKDLIEIILFLATFTGGYISLDRRLTMNKAGLMENKSQITDLKNESLKHTESVNDKMDHLQKDVTDIRILLENKANRN